MTSPTDLSVHFLPLDSIAESNSSCNMKPRRLASPVLAKFPWSSTTISSCEVLAIADEFTSFKNFIQALHNYESTLLNRFTANESITKVQYSLGLDFAGQPWQVVPRSTTDTPIEYVKLCSLISAYRLADVLAMLGGADRALIVERQFGLEVTNANFRGMDKLDDWPALMLQFRKTLDKSRKMVQISSGLDEGQSAPFRLLRLLACNNNTRSYTAIESNFLYAALHIACMKELQFPSEACPDVPDNLNRLFDAKTLSADDQDDFNDQHALIANICAKHAASDSVSYIRAPLQLALLISPIYLLLPIQLFKKSYNRHTMLNISSSLGNNRPQILLDVEVAIWKTLVALASGAFHPLDLLQRLSDNLPWDRIQAASSMQPERTWFNLGTLSAILPPEIPSLQPPANIENQDDTFENSLALAITHAQQPPPSTIDPSLLSASAPPMFHTSPMIVDQNLMTDAPFGLGDKLNASSLAECNEDQQMDEDRRSPGRVRIDGETDSRETLQSALAEGSEGPEDHQMDEDHSSPSGDVGIDGKEADRGTGVINYGLNAMPIQSSSRLRSQPAAEQKEQNKSHSVHRPAKRRRALRSSPEIPDSEEDLDSESFPSNSGTSANPIDVELYISTMWEPRMPKEFVKEEDPSFERSSTACLIKCHTELRAFDADGVEHRFTPEFHFSDCETGMKEFFGRIEAGYLDGKPLHIVDPKTSGFDIISFVDFQAMSPSQIQDRLRYKNIVVVGSPHPSMKFDEAGLRTLSPLDRQISIQDHSIRSPSGSPPVTVIGITKDILENAGPGRKILNGLEFPMWKDSQWDRCSYATDMVAWDYLRGKPHCGTVTTPYPTGHVRWGLAGTAHTVTSLHIDSDGFATFIQVMCGKKVWAIYCPSSDLPLSSTNAFISPELFQLDRVPEKAPYGLEAVVLRPGDLLLMRPGVPHYVYGPENAICHGGHFYASSLMQASLASLIHTFVLSNFITNTFHHASHDEYPHLPDIQTVNGLLDLISGCTLAILGNVLDFRTYSAPNQAEEDDMSPTQTRLWKEFDRNDIPVDERMAICYARGVALAVFRWIRSCCVIKTPQGEVVDDLPSKYMAQLLGALSKYKDKARIQDLEGAPHCTPSMLRLQILNVVQCDNLVKERWNKIIFPASDSLSIGLDPGCSVQWKDKEAIAIKRSTKLYQQDGMTPFDHAFLKGEQLRSQIEIESVTKIM